LITAVPFQSGAGLETTKGEETAVHNEHQDGLIP